MTTAFNIVGLIYMILAIILIIVPIKALVNHLQKESPIELLEDLMQEDKDQNDYYKQLPYLYTVRITQDYLRQNPLTEAEGWKMWYEVISKMEKNEDNKRAYKRIMVQAQNKNFSQRMEDYISRNLPIDLQPGERLSTGVRSKIIPITNLPNQFRAFRMERLNELLSQSRQKPHDAPVRIPPGMIFGNPRSRASTTSCLRLPSDSHSIERIEPSLNLSKEYQLIKIPPQPGQTQPTYIRVPKDLKGVYRIRPGSSELERPYRAYPYRKPPEEDQHKH